MREPPRPAPDRIKPLVALIKSAKPTNVGDWRNQRPVFVSQQPPCSGGCPAGEQIRDYIALALQGKMAEAWHLIKQDNPIPAIMGRVCYHPCENACNRVAFDESVSIHSLERRIGDYGLQQGLRVEACAANAMSVAVIGSGPAGLAAAYHLARRGYGVTVYEAAAQPGGMLRYGIPAYRLPREVLDAEIANIQALGIRFVCDAKIGDTVPWDTLARHAGVVVSAGCSAGRKLSIAGEGQPGILDGLTFLDAVNGGGASPVKPGGSVLVIGGGNVAIDVARVARRLGAGEVRLVFLETEAAMPAHPEEREDALAEGASLLPSRHFLRFESRKGRASGVRCVRIHSFRFDAHSNVIVDAVSGSEHVLEADTIVVAIGQRADRAFMPSRLAARWQEIAAGSVVQLGTHWVVGAGDFVEGPSSVVRAVGGGKRAAASLDARLRGEAAKAFTQPETVGFERLNMGYFAKEPRRQAPHRPQAERMSGFGEVVGPLSDEAFLAEAERCFHCGDCNYCSNCWVFCPESSISTLSGSEGINGLLRFQVDNVTCKGCGICMRECPRGAIVMEEELQ